ncbi:hypothetical protein TNCV_3581161 [Trichonephila clavipes]|nr:hypothetical protein TNCV_3581161 [Trichonephila clavipes]
MYQLSELRRVLIIRACLTGAPVSRTINLLPTQTWDPVSMKIIQQKSHADSIHGRVAILKPSVSVQNACEKITLMPRPPKPDTTKIGTSPLV